jgi:hypothetical protein
VPCTDALPVVLCRPWVKPPGPYDHTPKRPEAGQTLKYFNTQEGLQALAQDPVLASGAHITKAGLPPPKPVQPASAGGPVVGAVFLMTLHNLKVCKAPSEASCKWAGGWGQDAQAHSKCCY